MTVLIIGAHGQLGTDLCRAFAKTKLHTADLDGGDFSLDICDTPAVHRLIVEELKPDVVINAAAACNVPQCEERQAVAFAVNTTAAMHLARACKEVGARLVQISTDYVFGHGATKPITETSPTAPLSAYGASKLAGEHLIAAHCTDYIIVRTAAIYGAAPCRAKDGKNFVELMLHLAATQPEVRVVTDEITTPTYTWALAQQLRLLTEKGEPGIYHATCGGSCSWHEFAKAIFEATDTKVQLVASTVAEFKSAVQRPEYSVLENSHAQEQGLDIMPHWRDALNEYLEETGRKKSESLKVERR
ncbi:MAG: dTDP-4-dehydrorhamnose reductase [Candidatus Hydrogenedentes bacterium]|nr:dTDP-4-dehydrorhamnose reductase [Candidatus Hydrogenedentota bacterium]